MSDHPSAVESTSKNQVPWWKCWGCGAEIQSEWQPNCPTIKCGILMDRKEEHRCEFQLDSNTRCAEAAEPGRRYCKWHPGICFDTTNGLEEAAARAINTQIEPHLIKESPLTEKVLNDIKKTIKDDGPVIVIDSLETIPNCPCDQRGRNVSCERCKP